MGVERKKIGDIAKVYAGGTPSRLRPDFWGEPIPWVKTTQIQNCIINREDIDESITELGLKSSSARMVPKGTILMAMIGQGKTRGQVAILNVDAAINQNCVAIVFEDGIDRDYVWHQFLFRYKQIRNISNSSGQQNLNGEIIKGITLPFPDYEQQRLTGELLNHWDATIEKTEALIRAKQQQFSWLLKTLINDQSQNPDWQKTTLGNIGDISSAGVDKKFVDGEQDVRLVNYLDVYRRDTIYSDELSHYVTAPASKAEKCAVRKGDIFFTPSSEVRGDIGHSAVAMEDIPDAVYSYHIIRLRPSIQIDLLYSAYAFKTHSFYKQVARFADGSGQRYVVSQNNFREIEITLPPLPEQQHIAHTLNTAQAEIRLLQQLAKKHRTQKRGLMQKLLTGEWRVGMKNNTIQNNEARHAI